MMKTSKINRNLIVILFCLPNLLLAIPWPVGETGPDTENSFTIWNSYGEMNIDWDDAGPGALTNFHTGIDIRKADIGDESWCEQVWCIESGTLTDKWPNEIGQEEYRVVISPTVDDDEGWCYAHVQGDDGFPQDLSTAEVDYTAFSIGDLLGSMAEGVAPEKHLHFARTSSVTSSCYPGLDNPLDYLDPLALETEGFVWSLSSLDIKTFFLTDYPAIETTGPDNDWGELYPDPGSVFPDTLDRSDLSGAIDLFFNCLCMGRGKFWNIGVNPDVLAPQRVEWTLSKITDTGTNEVFTKYVFDFNGELGEGFNGADADWREYKRLYFMYRIHELMGSGPGAYITCLTNCGDATGYNGINNIEESCWNTALEAEGTGESYHPLDMETPDGRYRIDVTAYAWDENITHEYSFECMLCNTKEIAQEVHLTDAVTDQDVWHAEWVATYGTDGFSPEKNIYTNITAQPGTILDIEIIYSGPMSTTVTSNVRFTKPDEPCLTATPSTPEWTSTNQPDGYFDTWHGSVEIPVEGYSGWLTMEIKAKDISDIGLLDPSIADPDPPSGPADDEYTDDHHGFGIAFGIQPGWPITLSDKVYGSPVLGDIDGDGDLDISVLCADGLLYILDDDGSVMYDDFWPVDDGEWQEYLSTLTSSPALADIDGNGSLDIVGVHVEGCLAIDAASGEELDGWPCYPGISTIPAKFPGKSSPTVADVDGDGDLEVILTRHLTVPEITTLETSVFLIDHTGDCLWARNLNPPDGASVISTPAVGDVSSSHPGNEIVVCTAEGYQAGKDLDLFNDKFLNSAVYLLDPADGSDIVPPAYYSCYFWASPVVADIDDDGENEIIIGTGISGTSSRRVLVLDGNTLNEEHVWNVGSMVKHPVAVGDLNDDGILDVVAVDNSGAVNCWSGDDFSGGSQYDPLPGFPVTVVGVPAAPSIADIDGDFELEIVVGTGDGYLYAINYDGTICSGYPVSCGNGIYGQVAIGNIDDDNSLEMIFADDTDPVLYCYDLGAGTFPALMSWRQFQHDSWHTGCFEADNTVPEPPTNLSGEITYSGGCEVDLEWDLSVNDPYSGSPEEPTDVIVYKVMRRFSSFLAYRPIAKVHAGNDSYTDIFSPGGLMNSQVYYAVVACDGTNVSVYSNIIQFPTSPSDVISLGCSVVEEFSTARVLPGTLQISEMQASEMQASETQITEELSNAERTSVLEGTAETLSTVTECAVLSDGNPGCLTDGNTEVCYAPSPGADAVVIDLGDECTVTSVVPERMSGTSPDVSARRVETVRTLETAHAVEPSLLIEVAGSDREFYPFLDESRNSTDAVRYIRIRGASGLSEISVYGSRGTDNEVLSVEITRSVADEGWMFAIPVVEYSEEALVNIYDISGRMIWSGHSESGSVLHWDGFTENGTPVPNGVYLLQCSIGSEISTGNFVVRRE